MKDANPEQLYRLELFQRRNVQIIHRIPVDAQGLWETDKPAIWESAVDLQNPTDPRMMLHLQFSIPANTPGEAFANWQMARESAEHHVARELRSKIVLARR